MQTPSVKKMARSTTEGIYASTTTLLQDSFSSPHSKHNQHSNPSSPHQPARQDTGLTQPLPGSQLRRLGMDGLSALCSRSDNTSTATIDGFFEASASAEWLSGLVSSFSDLTAAPLPGCLDGYGNAHAQESHKCVADYASRKQAKSPVSRRTSRTSPYNTATRTRRSRKSRSSQSPIASVELQLPNESRADCVTRSSVTQDPSTQPTTHSEYSPHPIKVENEEEIELADTPHYSPAQNYDTGACSSLSPTLHPSIEHDDYEHENELLSGPKTLDNYLSAALSSQSPTKRSLSPYLYPSVEHETHDHYEQNFSHQSPDNYHPTIEEPTPTFQYAGVSQSPSPASSTQSADHQYHRHGSNKRSSDVLFLSLPPELNEREAKRQRLDEPQPNFCNQTSPLPTIQQADKRSHDAAFPGTGEIESVPSQSPKKQRTQAFKRSLFSQNSSSLRNLPSRRSSRFSLRDFLQKRNHPGAAATLPRFQFDGADDQPSANTNGGQEREMSPDSLFDDDECSPEHSFSSGERAASPDSLFEEDESECTGQDKPTPDAGVTLPDLSSAERECPSEQGGRESNPPAIAPQTATAPVVANKGTEMENAASERSGKSPAAFRAFNHQTTGQYKSPYDTCGRVRASVVSENPPPANLHSPSVEMATPREEGPIDVYRRRVMLLTRERDAARKKVEYWDFVDPATGKTREQMVKAEPMQLKRTLRAQERKTQNALSEVAMLKQQYRMLASLHNELVAKHSAVMGFPSPVNPPSNQVRPGPFPNGSGPVGGPAPSSSQRRSTMSPPKDGAAGGRVTPAPAPARAPAPANPQPGRVNFIDLTGEDPVPAARAPVAAAAVTQPPAQFPAVPRPTLSWAPFPAVAAQPSGTNRNVPAAAAAAAPVNRAPVPAPVPAPGVPAAAATPATVARQPQAALHPTTRCEPIRRTSANANYNRPNSSAAPTQAAVSVTRNNNRAVSIPPINTNVATSQSPAPVPDKSTSPEAEELRNRFRTKDYSWIQGNNHMTNRRRPVFGLGCAPPVPTLPVDVPASRFKREREKQESAVAAAAARRKSRVEKNKAKAAARAESVTVSSTSPDAENEGSVGMSMTPENEDELAAEWERDMWEELAKPPEEGNQGNGEEEEGAGEQAEAEAGEGYEEPGYTDEQILRMMEGDFDDEES